VLIGSTNRLRKINGHREGIRIQTLQQENLTFRQKALLIEDSNSVGEEEGNVQYLAKVAEHHSEGYTDTL
jgi:hypothetical protein